MGKYWLQEGETHTRSHTRTQTLKIKSGLRSVAETRQLYPRLPSPADEEEDISINVKVKGRYKLTDQHLVHIFCNFFAHWHREFAVLALLTN